MPVGEVLGPLVDRAGNREVGADLGEVQSDDELTDRNQWPAPDECRSADAEPKCIEGDDSCRRRAARDSARSAGVAPQGPPLLPLAAKPRQDTKVDMLAFFLQLRPPP